jgi:hypothetical protein
MRKCFLVSARLWVLPLVVSCEGSSPSEGSGRPLGEAGVGDGLDATTVDVDAYRLDAADMPVDGGEPSEAIEGPSIDFVAPSSNVSGGAILVVGKKLAGAGLSIGGRNAAIVSSDPSVPGYEKVVATVPANLTAGSTELVVAVAGGGRASKPFVVASSIGAGAISGSVDPYGIATYNQYPPIDNVWTNECAFSQNSYEDSYTLSSDPSPAGSLDAAADRSFTGTHTLNFLGNALTAGTISGSFSEVSHLFFMDVTDEDAGTRSYVGTYSDTQSTLAYRLVLFPKDVAGRQLTLFMCPSSGATDWMTCTTDDGGLPAPGPPSCSSVP